MNRPYRPADGIFRLTQLPNEDFIPAGPGPKPLRTMSLPAALPETRQRKVTWHYDPEKCACVISLGLCEPDAEKAEISSAIRAARTCGPLHLITVVIESETYGTPSAFHFFRRNGFSRNEGRESDMQTRGQIVLEKVVK
jgi:hypothetical protein